MLKTLTVDRKLLVLFNAWVLIAGLVYSPFLLSVSMWIFAVYSLVDFRFGKGKTFLRFDRAAVKRMLRFYRNPPFFAVTLFFFLVVLSVWQTEDWSYWLERVRIKIPFLIFPLMFLALPRFTKREVMGLFYFMLILMLVSCLGVGINYALHFEEINLAIKQGRSMPTPRDHIRFSLLLALIHHRRRLFVPGKILLEKSLGKEMDRRDHRFSLSVYSPPVGTQWPGSLVSRHRSRDGLVHFSN